MTIKRIALTAVLSAFIAFFLPARDITVDEFEYEINSTTNITLKKIKEPTSLVGDITIPATFNIDGKNLYIKTFDESCFANCQNLTSLIIENSENFVYINSKAFSFCKNLKLVELPEYLSQIASNTFDGCSNLMGVKTNSYVFTTTISESTDFYKGLQKAYLYVPDSEYNEYLKNLSYESSKSDDLKFLSCFLDIKKLSEFDEKDLEPAVVGEYELSFVPDGQNLKVSGVKNKRANGKIVLPASVEYDGELRKVTGIYGTGAFEKCYAIKEIEILCDETVKTYPIPDNSFSGCSSLRKITLPNGISNINTKAFDKCPNLHTIIYPGQNEIFASNNKLNVVLYIQQNLIDQLEKEDLMEYLEPYFGAILPIGTQENVVFKHNSYSVEMLDVMVGHTVEFIGFNVEPSADDSYKVEGNTVTILKHGGFDITGSTSQLMTLAEDPWPHPGLRVDENDTAVLRFPDLEEGDQMIVTTTGGNTMYTNSTGGCTIESDGTTHLLTITDPTKFFAMTISNDRVGFTDPIKPAVSVSVSHGEVCVEGLDDTDEVVVVDLQGRKRSMGNARRFALPAGLYIISTPEGNVKVAI